LNACRAVAGAFPENLRDGEWQALAGARLAGYDPRSQGGLVYVVFVSPERDFNSSIRRYQKKLDSLQIQ